MLCFVGHSLVHVQCFDLERETAVCRDDEWNERCVIIWHVVDANRGWRTGIRACESLKSLACLCLGQIARLMLCLQSSTYVWCGGKAMDAEIGEN